jgi:hypothetical protein
MLLDFFTQLPDEKVTGAIYSLLHHSFGLPSFYTLSRGRSGVHPSVILRDSALKTRMSGDYVQSFSITGPRLIPQFFLQSDSLNVFNKIDRDIVVPQGKRYVYDISEIQDGRLSAYLAYEGSKELQESDERRWLMHRIGVNFYQEWKTVPLSYVELGDIYAQSGIPDRIYLQFPSFHEARKESRDAMIRDIAIQYGVTLQPHVNVTIQQDAPSSSMNLVSAFIDTGNSYHEPIPETVQEPVTPEQPQFPFEYYHSIGLIDDEGMVTMDTILGPMRFPANSEEGIKILLSKGQS